MMRICPLEGSCTSIQHWWNKIRLTTDITHSIALWNLTMHVYLECMIFYTHEVYKNKPKWCQSINQQFFTLQCNENTHLLLVSCSTSHNNKYRSCFSLLFRFQLLTRCLTVSMDTRRRLPSTSLEVSFSWAFMMFNPLLSCLGRCVNITVILWSRNTINVTIYTHTHTGTHAQHTDT